MAGRTTSKIVLGLLIAVVVGSLLAACQPDPYPSAEYDEFIDRSLITGDPCEPPCWYGIEPGDSEEDTIPKLEGIPFVDTSSIEIREDSIIWKDTIPAEKGGGYLELRQGQVEYVSCQLQYLLTMEEVIDVYGEPHGTSVNATRGAGGRWITVLCIYWPQQGFEALIFFELEHNESAFILADTVIERIGYYEKQDTVEMVFQDLMPEVSLERAMQNYFQWKGYGPVF
jgi:hypothetical protein